MNTTLKAVVVQLSGGNVRNSHINPRGIFGLFPDDCRGGESAAGKPVSVRSGAEEVAADIDKTKAIFRERGAIRRFFKTENVEEGDLVLVERLEERSFRVSKASKRGFNYYL